MQNLRIDIAVKGLFHADYLAAILKEAGHTVDVYTSLRPTDFPRVHENRLHVFPWRERLLRRSFGAWVARTSARRGRAKDLSILWASGALETLRRRPAARQVVVRDSAHILFQNDVLAKEFRRLKLSYPDLRRSIDRELAEYALADQIWVPSAFARRTFLERGFSEDKVRVLRLGVNVSLFQADVQIAPRRPLRVVYFGSLSVQKGVHYLLEATRGFPETVLQVDLVGEIHPEFKSILEMYPHAKYHPSMSPAEKAGFLQGKDVFVFPCLHDGFGQPLGEAMASGMVGITTDHCGAAEWIKEGENGFVVPAGNVLALRDRLNQLSEDLPLVKKMRQAASEVGKELSWKQYRRSLAEAIGALFNEPPPAES